MIESMYKISCSWVDMLIFVSYLESHIWSDVISAWTCECASNFVQISEKVWQESLAMIRQAFREESMSCARVFEWQSPTRRDPKWRQVRTQEQSTLIIFFDILGFFIRILSWQARQFHTLDILPWLHENGQIFQPRIWLVDVEWWHWIHTRTLVFTTWKLVLALKGPMCAENGGQAVVLGGSWLGALPVWDARTARSLLGPARWGVLFSEARWCGWFPVTPSLCW
jgi:hypothetical protein